jgi:hypothetical protein
MMHGLHPMYGWKMYDDSEFHHEWWKLFACECIFFMNDELVDDGWNSFIMDKFHWCVMN